MTEEHRKNLSDSLKRFFSTPRGEDVRKQIADMHRGSGRAAYATSQSSIAAKKRRESGELASEGKVRLWSRIIKSDIDSCWPFTGNKHKDGYGSIKFEGRRWLTHRLVWHIDHGPIPEGVQVLHKCDNPPCCNPHHLFSGTQLDNMADMKAKGRRKGKLVGEQVHFSKLTPEKVTAIRQMAARGVKHGEIARTYGVSDVSISCVVTRKTWRHLP